MLSAEQILKMNQAMREGVSPAATRLDDGFTEFRIPVDDDKKRGIPGYHTLMRLFPELRAPDPDVRRTAWERLRNSELGALYLVVKTPRQVKRETRYGNRGIITK